ncbi:MAG TPA: regulatory protein RecX [Candidatus Limnocylindria bacterium]|jgi:regulatory protein
MTGRRGTSTPRAAPDDEGAMEIAARYLGARPRTRWELERRLRRAGVEEPTVERTLERLATLGFVDDRAFARWWAEQRDRHAPRGRRMVEAELRQHGVPREIIEELRGSEIAEPALDHHGLPATEDDRALAALDRHLRGRPIPDDRRAVERIGMYLVRRGFDPETARRAIRTRREPA